ncbi:hypothetical protein BDW02DRAFT_500484 [Decorospora gaudefroyi]|uniref:Pinin/SDK/MemA protein domain-containing protein n=1 Tax=Decorospora gaudefroyi TaxID=184978 RepID=A0A6A5KJB4_9PLEO|nr:hypothetical protein BDW02DRAFT_500484 [Decorospora gaudefroyi]
MAGPIASAIVLPEELAIPASPVTGNGHKRRQESTSDDNAKRPRLSEDSAASEGRNATKDPKPAPVRRERGRERRLFGAALGALSQNSATTAQKRRTEIEKRQLAQRRQDDEESEQRKAERLARRKEQRWKEQKHFERKSLRTRHQNLLSMAHFLQTKAEPHLYYKPWETTSDEEDRIQDQIAEAERTIKREVDDYEARQQQDDQRRRHTPGEAGRDADGSDTGKNHNADAPRETSTTNDGANGSANMPKDFDMKDQHPDSPGTEAVRAEADTAEVQESNIPSNGTIADQSSKDDDDEDGEDVVEEAAEDTVIY